MTDITTQSPLEDFRQLALAPLPDRSAARAATLAREAALTKPAGSLGRLEEISLWLTEVSGKAPPTVAKPRVVIFAAAHGVADAGVSAFPSSVNQQMLAAFQAGKAAINQICSTGNIGLSVFDLAVDIPSGNIVSEDAFASEKDLAATLAFGLEAIAGGIDCLGIGEMGIGNTTVAAAIYAALYGGSAADWCGAGTGVTGEGLRRKIDAVDAALARIGPERDPLTILQRIGGRDIAAMAGAILAARTEGVPVVVDGFVASAAAAIVHAMGPDATAHCLFAHCSAESAHGRALEAMGGKPLLDLGMRLGEGTGAALAIGILKAAAACHSGMATFAEAGVDGPA
ncbi:nicotinate-nucleotide--dimethylbenzimidazole phosphoribosyltransferase [Acuticoccus sp. MNP-M23]|uniref:nicotinate-nucleotide--dimethylbenzimidazole phosphoribosyltransferase n=1 Tax=Acuticoccus sp. MNP-M23 TaxID=3072793 RepID=UPI002815EBFD|nr:nicotinate-nucleotide--dimethylbenzimidazole phosphoribosyltransferase [Acuticoccus sp. MNP-M23]WMS42059.1 nicotinate-nucleotide--dimethylbenzimidazole phosphoribosyltransferase [Acuticoccus sp. MNP-M23]